jgi:hypothetical protein
VVNARLLTPTRSRCIYHETLFGDRLLFNVSARQLFLYVFVVSLARFVDCFFFIQTEASGPVLMGLIRRSPGTAIAGLIHQANQTNK